MLDNANVTAIMPLDNVADDAASFGNSAFPFREHGR